MRRVKITRQDMANTAAERFREVSGSKYQAGRFYKNKDTQAKLDALGPEPDPDDVDHALGYEQTLQCCYSCGMEVEEAVCFEFDFDGRKEDVSFCGGCIRAMGDLIASKGQS